MNVFFLALLSAAFAQGDLSDDAAVIIGENIEAMHKDVGFDVIVICTTTTSQAKYWQDRLILTKGTIAASNSIIVGVDEDWNGKAGNGMGTLYAFVKASAKVQELYGIDLVQKLANLEISIAIYHTAGKGTRLAPIHLAENSNKPGVKLPSLLHIKGSKQPVTILESVIKQTGAYASSRKGRVSVFWGDQVFIPSVKADYKPIAHVDLLAQLGPMPTEEQWKTRGLQKYGLVAINEKGEGAQVEKVRYSEATKLLSSLGEVKNVGTSLGSFSLSHPMLQAMLQAFAPELEAKSGEMDTDPHFWMPLTLSLDGYLQIMVTNKNDMTVEEATTHHARIRSMLTDVQSSTAETYQDFAMLGAVDVGVDALWWDYGNLKVYSANNLLLTRGTAEAAMLKKFMGLVGQEVQYSQLGSATTDQTSVVLSSSITDGQIKRSVLTDVKAASVDVEDSILIGVSANAVSCKKCILYGIADKGDLNLEEGTVLAEVMQEDGRTFRMRSNLETDGKKSWKKKVHGNTFSFDQVHKANVKSDLLKIIRHIERSRVALRDEL